MYEKIRSEAARANRLLAEYRLVILAWGNASAIDREAGVAAIKPSGLPCGEAAPENMVIVDLAGRVVEGTLRPSSDTATHLVLYQAFPEIGGVVHTHSSAATAWAQAGRALPVLGTTHADTFYGPVPCTPPLTGEDAGEDYEKRTGEIILRTFSGLSPSAVPAASSAIPASPAKRRVTAPGSIAPASESGPVQSPAARESPWQSVTGEVEPPAGTSMGVAVMVTG